jgi:hypothetical protein
MTSTQTSAEMSARITVDPGGDVLVVYETEARRSEYRLRDRRPETRILTRGGGMLRDGTSRWRRWQPDSRISPLSPVLQFFAERMICAVCNQIIPYATILAAVQRGGLADYCSPKHRRTAAKRRERATT